MTFQAPELRPEPAVDLEAGHAALAALPKDERDEILRLPTKEAMTIIRLLVAFPGSTFVANDEGPRRRHDPSTAEIPY